MGVWGITFGKILLIADASILVLAHFGTKQQQFTTPDFMPVNLSISRESVELEILQVGEMLNEQ
jgi:hypothetical protein